MSPYLPLDDMAIKNSGALELGMDSKLASQRSNKSFEGIVRSDDKSPAGRPNLQVKIPTTNSSRNLKGVGHQTTPGFFSHDKSSSKLSDTQKRGRMPRAEANRSTFSKKQS